MAKKIIIIVSILATLGFSLAIAFPIVIFSTVLKPYGEIDEKISFYCTQNNISAIDELNLNIDAGNIQINYIDPLIDYAMKIDVKVEMIGSGLAGKSYFDYFNIVWQNTSGSVNFTMRVKAGITQTEILSLIKNVIIIVTLNANVFCDISVNVNVQGDIKITVPWGISVGQIFANVSRGDIQFDFYNCIIDGNLTGLVQKESDLELKSYDVEFTQNSMWSLSTNTGDILIEIDQNKAMNANITGIIATHTGNYLLTYRDSTTEVGAYFILHVNPEDFGINQKITEIVGFEYYVSAVNGTDVYHITSDDYPTQYNYDLLFNFPIGTYEELELHNT